MDEVRVYVVDLSKYIDLFQPAFDSENPLIWNDKKFISEAEIQGTVFTLKGFERAVNYEGFKTENSFIRFV